MSERFPEPTHEQEKHIPKHENREGYKAYAVNALDYIRTKSRDVALERMTEHRDNLEGFKGFLTRVWKHNFFRDYYLHKEAKSAEEELKEEDIPEKLAETIEQRFLSEYDEAIHEEAGEYKKVFSGTEEEKQLSNAVKNLIKDYVAGNIEESDFVEEKGRLYRDIFGADKDSSEAYFNPVDNALDLARHIKASADHQKALNALDEDFELVIGKAKPGVRTEADFGPVDKIVDKLKDKKITSVVNEATLATGVSIAYSVAGFASRSFAHNKIAQVASFGSTAFIAGGLAAARENVQQKRERSQHMRETAQGKYPEDEEKEQERRKEMDEFTYEAIKAPVAINTLKEVKDYIENLEELTQEEFEKIVHPIAVTEATISFSDRERVDLIRYSSEEQVDQERLDLDIARAEAKVALKNAISRNPDFTIPGQQDLGDYLESAKSVIVEGNISEEVKEKDERFKKYKKGKVARAAAKGLITGAVIGGVAQEVTSTVRGDQQGVVEGLSGKTPQEGATVTPLESLRNYINYQVSPPTETVIDTETVPTLEQHELEYDRTNIFEVENAKYRLPENFSLIEGEDGTYILLRDNETVLDGLEVDEEGLFTDAAIQEMQRQDFNLDLETTTVEKVAEVETTEEVLSTQEFVSENTDEFQSITRDIWYDNNTPGVATQNELRLLWGEDGTGIDADGNFVYDVSRMTADGSFHRDFSVDAQEAMEQGRLKLFLSMSGDTQQLTYDVPIDANGHAVIDPESDVAKHLFEERNGQAVFKGRFAEVAEVIDTQEDGTEVIRPLATAEGDGIQEVSIEKEVEVTEEVDKHDVRVGFDDWVEGEREVEVEREEPLPREAYNIEAPPIIPFFGRYPLEPLASAEKSEEELEAEEAAAEVPPVAKTYFETYFSTQDPELKKFFAERRSETLDNPEAELDHRKEEGDYFLRQEKSWMETVEKLNDQLGGPMDPECRLAVCIPVAGHQESENIYNTLEHYAKQKTSEGKPLDSNNFEIILFVNNPENRSSEDTLQEIERFKKDYPYMPVRAMHKTLNEEEAKMGTIRKYLTDVALFRNHERGSSSSDLLIASNDADCEGISDTYIENYIKQFEDNPDIEGMLGKLDWDPEAYVKSPLLHTGTRFFQILDALARHPKEGEKKHIASSGANFVFRGSIYSAIGGYIEEDEVAEDKHLGQMIADAREEGEYPLEYAGPKSVLYTNARRGIDALKKEKAPAEQWEEGFNADDALREEKWQIETQDVKELLNNNEKQEEFRENLNNIINRTIEVYGLEPDSENVERALGFMGIKYKVEGGSVNITDTTSLIEDLKYYREKYLRNKNEEEMLKKGAKYAQGRVVESDTKRKGTFTKKTFQPTEEQVEQARKEMEEDLQQREGSKEVEADNNVGDSVESEEEYERTFTFADFLRPHEQKSELSDTEKEERIKEAKSFGDVYQAVDGIGGIVYEDEVLSGERIKELVEQDRRLRKKENRHINFEMFPEKYGLRQKVQGMLRDEADNQK